MINIDQINFSYHRRQAPVLSNFSLTIEPGRIYGLLGKNGTGKSTLLYLMAGLLRPQQGHVQFTTEDGNLTLEASERRPEMLCETFFVPEEFDLPNIPLKRYVDLNAPFYPKFSHEILNQCLTDFELPQNLHLGALSMGQKKKAFMSFALATNCRLLLMDEPTNVEKPVSQSGDAPPYRRPHADYFDTPGGRRGHAHRPCADAQRKPAAAQSPGERNQPGAALRRTSHRGRHQRCALRATLHSGQRADYAESLSGQ